MSRKLAIKGHPTRGKEVIELLEMMGGVNDRGYIGTNTWKDEYYTLDNGYIRVYDWSDDIKFTLEEFLKKYSFKVGDKVEVCETGKVFTIGNMIWEDEFAIVHYANMEDIEYYTAKELKLHKETKIKPNKCTQCVYAVNNDHCGLRGFRSGFNVNYCSAQNVDKLPNGFELQEDGYFSWVNKKPTYPKTYEECCEILVGRKPSPYEISFDKMELCLVDLDHTQNIDFQNPQLFQLNGLFRLLMCRDAYWKIVGEEMGLDEPWEPDWKHLNRKFYCIYNSKNNIVKNVTYGENKILAFPTEEMRDVFYKNFKDLIEQCKELL